MERAKRARYEMRAIFMNESHPLFFCKDIEFARRFSVNRHTICSIRAELNIKSRCERLRERLSKLDLTRFTLNDLSGMLNVKYQNLYKVIVENGMKIKPDIRPVEHMKEYQRNNRGKRRKKKKKKIII